MTDSAEGGPGSAGRGSPTRRSPSPTHRIGRAHGAVCPHRVQEKVVDMMVRTEAKARALRQERLAKMVWGSLFVVMGVLFTLHDMRRIDLGEPKQEFAAGHAVDGDDKTRWGSAF